MNKKLRKATVAILGTAALAGVATQASARSIYADLGTLTNQPLVEDNITGQVFGWTGQNNYYTGWTHSTQWMLFNIASTTSVEIRSEAIPPAPPQPGQLPKQNLLLPAFTVWATSPTAGFVPLNHDPNYSYKANNIYGGVPTHPYNQVQGAPSNLDGQQTPVSPEPPAPPEHGPTCPAGGCNSNNWLAPGGGGANTTDGITTLVGYVNSSPAGSWINGNGDVVGRGMVGSDNNGQLDGSFIAVAPDWSEAAGGPSNTIQSATLQLYNLSAGTYLIAPGGGCLNLTTQPGSDCFKYDGYLSTLQYKLTVSQITAPIPIPAAVWLFGSALGGLAVFGRRKGKTSVC